MTPRRRRWRGGAYRTCALAIAVGLASCGGRDDSGGTGKPETSVLSPVPTVEVRIGDTSVQPAAAELRIGEAARVTNVGTSQHRLSGTKLDTGVLRPGESTLLFAAQSGRFELRLDDFGAVALVVTISPGPASAPPRSPP